MEKNTKVILKVVFEPYTLIEGMRKGLKREIGMRNLFSDNVTLEVRRIEVVIGAAPESTNLSLINVLDKIILFYDEGMTTEYYGKINQIDYGST